ncbi:MAG: type II secretion system F family protein [Patescibacteria group bacterium]|nr:type II secretion system F family protein [Patescibacteria group bacterium]
MIINYFKKILRPSLSMRDRIIFADRMSLLVGAGHSLPEAVHLLNSTFGKRRTTLLEKMAQLLSEGVSLETALINSNIGFGNDIVLAARIGEKSGTLERSFIAAAQSIKRRRLVRSGIISAALYPLIVFVASTGVIFFLVFYIMPKIIPTIESLHVPLPFLTVFFIAISHGVVLWWWKGGLIILAISVLLFSLYESSYLFRKILHSFLLRVPIIFRVIQAHILSEFFSTLATLVSTGYPFIDAIEESAAAIAIIPYRLAFDKVSKEMKLGFQFSVLLSNYPRLMPKLAVDGLAIGERTGEFEKILVSFSDYYARDLESILDRISKLIEPMMMVGVGVIIGAAALSIVMPIYEISSHVSGK